MRERGRSEEREKREGEREGERAKRIEGVE